MRRIGLTIGGVLLSLLATSAFAQVSPGAGKWSIGGYAGYYMVEPDVLDDAGTGGVRRQPRLCH